MYMTFARLNKIHDPILWTFGKPTKRKGFFISMLWYYPCTAQFWLTINRVIFKNNWTNASIYSRCFST